MHFARHCLVVALGIDGSGVKHVLGLWDGSTENAAVSQGLLANLVERGLRLDRSILVVLDGSKALRVAVDQALGRAAWVQRCQVHKLRNVRHVHRNVKRWRGRSMALRWAVAGVQEAAKGFKRLRGHKDMRALVNALRARDEQLGLTPLKKVG